MDNDLSKSIAAVIEGCLEKGMQLPFHLAVVAINGSAIVARYTEANDEGLDCEILAQHYENGAFKLPINWMIVDATGEAARVTIESGNLSIH